MKELSLALCFADGSSSDSECESDGERSSCSSSSDSEVFDVIAEIKRKKAHPDRLHEELWYNDPGQVGLMWEHIPAVMLRRLLQIEFDTMYKKINK